MCKLNRNHYLAKEERNQAKQSHGRRSEKKVIQDKAAKSILHDFATRFLRICDLDEELLHHVDEACEAALLLPRVGLLHHDVLSAQHTCAARSYQCQGIRDAEFPARCSWPVAADSTDSVATTVAQARLLPDVRPAWPSPLASPRGPLIFEGRITRRPVPREVRQMAGSSPSTSPTSAPETGVLPQPTAPRTPNAREEGEPAPCGSAQKRTRALAALEVFNF